MNASGIPDGKLLSAARFAQLRAWLYRNARNVDLAAFRFFFEGGAAEDVAQALLPYRCENGGFGHALEADNWNPDATPITTEDAYKRLRDVGLARSDHPLVAGICRYFELGEAQTARGWAFNVPGNDAHPHAPWWTYSETENEKEYLGVSCEAVAIALSHAPEGSAFRARARRLAAPLLAALDAKGGFGDMGLEGLQMLLEALEKPGVAAEAGLTKGDVSAAWAKLGDAVRARVERDPAKWGGYTVTPSRVLHAPDSPYLPGFETLLAQDLDRLIDTLPEGDAWPIPWTWFDLMPKYAAQFAVAETWWKAVRAIENLRVLRAFGRLEGSDGG